MHSLRYVCILLVHSRLAFDCLLTLNIYLCVPAQTPPLLDGDILSNLPGLEINKYQGLGSNFDLSWLTTSRQCGQGKVKQGPTQPRLNICFP